MRRSKKVPTAGIGKQVLAAQAVQNFMFRVDSHPQISPTYSDGTATAKMRTGRYTYKSLFTSVSVSAQTDVPASPGTSMTVLINGTHYVKTQYLPLLISKMELEINGGVEISYQTDRLVSQNQHYGYDGQDGFLVMSFGGPNEFRNPLHEDAFLLGTANLDSVDLNYELTAAWDTATMKLNLLAEYALAERITSHFSTVSKNYESLPSSGRHSIIDIPTNVDIAQIYVFGTDIEWCKLEIGDEVVFKGTYAELQAVNALAGRDTTALGECLLFDFWRGKNASQGMLALKATHQRRNNDVIRLTVDVAAATELVIETRTGGRFVSKR